MSNSYIQTKYEYNYILGKIIYNLFLFFIGHNICNIEQGSHRTIHLPIDLAIYFRLRHKLNVHHHLRNDVIYMEDVPDRIQRRTMMNI